MAYIENILTPFETGLGFSGFNFFSDLTEKSKSLELVEFYSESFLRRLDEVERHLKFFIR